jgi:hypothetical protein
MADAHPVTRRGPGSAAADATRIAGTTPASPDGELLDLEREVLALRREGREATRLCDSLRGEPGWQAACDLQDELLDRECTAVERLLALPAQTADGRAAKVRVWLLSAVSKGTCDQLVAPRCDWEFLVLRKVLADTAGLPEVEIMRLASDSLQTWEG